jgi:C4-dicarboxylate transporter DctQ subunit
MSPRVVNRLEEGALATVLAAMTLLTFLQVVLRYGFNTGFGWALEATTYMFGWMVLLGMSYGVRVGSHIGVDLIVKQLPPRGQYCVGVLAGFLCAAYAAILLFGSWNYVDTMHTLGVEAEDLPIQRWILLSVLPIGFLMLLWRLAQLTWRIIVGAQTGFHLADEAREAIDQLRDESPTTTDRTSS